MNEADWQSRIVDTAMLHGWRVAHFRAARTSKGWRTPVVGHIGLPDLILARGGVVVLAELKAERGKLGPGQPEWLDALGVHGRLWRPSNWPAVLAELSAHQRAA